MRNQGNRKNLMGMNIVFACEGKKHVVGHWHILKYRDHMKIMAFDLVG